MPHITAEEWQLLSFFAAEPALTDADVPWCYNHAVYQVRQGAFVLTCAIDPAYRDVQIVLEHETARLYEFKAMAVKDVRYTNDEGREQLAIEINDHERLVLRITPHLELSQQCDGIR